MSFIILEQQETLMMVLILFLIGLLVMICLAAYKIHNERQPVKVATGKAKGANKQLITSVKAHTTQTLRQAEVR